MASARDVERDRLIRKITRKRAKLEARGDLSFKARRVALPEDFDINDRSIFSLPPELLHPVLASSYPKYRKRLADQKKKGNRLNPYNLLVHFQIFLIDF
nr:unnamed protein product [Callosobruchus analis]